MADADPTRELEGATAVLTGATRGIGRAVAAEFARQGAAVLINGRDAAAVEQTVAELSEDGAVALGIVGSAADPGVVEEMRAVAESAFGAVDALVNCAGTAEPVGSSILDIEIEDWRGLIDAHLTSTFLTCRAFAPGMARRGRGTIVNTSSHAFTGMYGGTGYAAGKGGVNSLTYALAAELAEHGIRVNAVCPGARTRLSTGPEYERSIDRLRSRGLIDDVVREASLNPAGPEYVAPLYAYLASARADGITGRVLAAAGGYLGAFDAPRERLIDWRDAGAAAPWTVAEVAARLSAGD